MRENECFSPHLVILLGAATAAPHCHCIYHPPAVSYSRQEQTADGRWPMADVPMADGRWPQVGPRCNFIFAFSIAAFWCTLQWTSKIAAFWQRPFVHVIFAHLPARQIVFNPADQPRSATCMRGGCQRQQCSSDASNPVPSIIEDREAVVGLRATRCYLVGRPCFLADGSEMRSTAARR